MEHLPLSDWGGIYILPQGLWKTYYLNRKRHNNESNGILWKI